MEEDAREKARVAEEGVNLGEEVGGDRAFSKCDVDCPVNGGGRVEMGALKVKTPVEGPACSGGEAGPGAAGPGFRRAGRLRGRRDFHVTRAGGGRSQGCGAVVRPGVEVSVEAEVYPNVLVGGRDWSGKLHGKRVGERRRSTSFDGDVPKGR